MDNDIVELIKELHALKTKMLDGDLLRDGVEDLARMNYLTEVLSPFDIVGALLTRIETLDRRFKIENDKNKALATKLKQILKQQQINNDVYS